MLRGYQPPESPQPARRTVRSSDVAAYLCYLALTLWSTARLWPGLDTRMVDGSHGGNEDYRLFEWFLAYDARTVRHLQNPFLSTLQNAPDGVNLMSNTGLVGLGVPLAPVTWLAGPTVTCNLIICLALFCTAASWYQVLSRYLATSRLAAAVGGALCGFGPGMLAHSRGHLNLVAQFLLPVIILLVLRLAEPGRLVRCVHRRLRVAATGAGKPPRSSTGPRPRCRGRYRAGPRGLPAVDAVLRAAVLPHRAVRVRSRRRPRLLPRHPATGDPR